MYFVHLLIFFYEEIALCLFVLLVKNGSYNHKKFIKDVKRSVYKQSVPQSFEINRIWLVCKILIIWNRLLVHFT